MPSRRPVFLLALLLVALHGQPAATAGGGPGSTASRWAPQKLFRKVRPAVARKAPAHRVQPPHLSPGRRAILHLGRARGAANSARRERTADSLLAAGLPASQLRAAAEHVGLGMPSQATTTNPQDFLDVQPGFVLSYNRTRRAPNWVAVKITRSDVTGPFSSRLKFRRNMKIPEDWAATPGDYKGVYAAERLTKGHLVGSGDQTGDPESHKATYQLGNIVPQLYENNAGPWHDFETYLRDEARQTKDVYVFAGGVYGRQPRTIGKNRVAVPTATWKVAVVVEPGQKVDSPSTKVMYLVVPNEAGKVKLNETFEPYLRSGPEVEAMTGLRFFTGEAAQVREQLLAQSHRPVVPVRYWSRRKIAEIRTLGLKLPANVQMDPRDRTIPERVKSLGNAVRRVVPARPAAQQTAPP